MFDAASVFVVNTDKFEELICVGCTEVDIFDENEAKICESSAAGPFRVVEGAESTVVTIVSLVYVGVVSDELANPAMVCSCLCTTVVTQSV